MPYILSETREEILEIKNPGSFYDRRKSNWLDSSYFVADAVTGQKMVRPGLVLAKNTTTNKWVPYNVSASYGPGSDGTASEVTVLDTLENVTLGDVAVAPLYHGKLIQAHCYIFGGALGTISAAVKTAAPDLAWV